jgi:hypothetical protein
VIPSEAVSLKLTKALTLAPARSATAGALVLGTAPSVAANLLPGGFTAGLSAPQGAAVNLGSYTFKRYLDLLPQGAATPLSVYSLPTTLGTAIVACLLPQSGATAFAATCERAVASLKTSGTPRPLTASATYASELSRIVSQLDLARRAAGQRLASAKTQPDQASAARALALAYGTAATAAAKLTPGPIGAAANGTIVGALHTLDSEYQSLAAAAGHNNRRSYAAAESGIGRADSALGAGFTQLRQNGFAVS